LAILRGTEFQFLTDVSGQTFFPVFKTHVVQEKYTA